MQGRTPASDVDASDGATVNEATATSAAAATALLFNKPPPPKRNGTTLEGVTASRRPVPRSALAWRGRSRGTCRRGSNKERSPRRCPPARRRQRDQQALRCPSKRSSVRRRGPAPRPHAR